MKFKNILALSLTATSLLTLAACGGSSTPEYKVSFDSGSKGSYVAAQTIKEGEKASKPTNPTHEDGNSFVEWKLDGGTYNFDKEVTKDITLTAEWAANSYTVTFTTDYESTGLTVAAQTVGDGGTATQPDKDSLPYRSGYEITGWTLNSATYDFTGTVTESIELKAVWSAVTTYTVTFDANGGTGTTTTQTINEGRSPEFPTLTKTDYYLDGWTNDNLFYDATAGVTSNVDLVAKWLFTKQGSNFPNITPYDDSENVSGVTYVPSPTNASDQVIQLQRDASSSTSNWVKDFSNGIENDITVYTFDVYSNHANASATTIKFYAGGNSSSNEVARMKINGTSSNGGSANIQWGVGEAVGAFSNTSVTSSSQRISSNNWYTVQVVFQYFTENDLPQLYGRIFMNGVELKLDADSNGVLAAIYVENQGFRALPTAVTSVYTEGVGMAENYRISSINFSPDKQNTSSTSTAEEQLNHKMYLNNFRIESITNS
ncbi:MAG: InlB B-repeat-containing protein [bacterium]